MLRRLDVTGRKGKTRLSGQFKFVQKQARNYEIQKQVTDVER